jgi:DNA processing protein
MFPGAEMDETLRELVQREVLFSKEAADFLGISPQRLNQLVHSGQLHPIRRCPSGALFLKSDLEKRRMELKEIGRSLAGIGGDGKMDVNKGAAIEAIRFFTVQNALSLSEKKTEPLFNQLDLETVVEATNDEFFQMVSREFGLGRSATEEVFRMVESAFEKLEKSDQIIKRGSESYPKLLAKTDEAPRFLFARGNLDLLNERTVSIVGTRTPTEEGVFRANYLAKWLSGNCKIVIASGLARGIDTAAHNGALAVGGSTISVIGTPLSKAYPAENQDLQVQISKKGLVISQFPPSNTVGRWNFPMRNAVMSGISLATVVIEAGETSGALIQANYALKQKRLVFIPQSALDNPNLKWPKKYIEKEGARSFKKIDELLAELGRMDIITRQEPENRLQLKFNIVEV